MPYVANKSNLAQLTNIHYWDSVGNAWSGNLIGTATPFAFLPNPVVANDLVLFGIDSSIVNSGPFCSLVFDLGAAITGVTGITWTYSDASGADPLAPWAVQGGLQDNTDQGGLMTGVAFDTSGVNSVHWSQDTLWIVQNPTIGGVALGVTGWWICAQVTAATGAGTPPQQSNRSIYTITWSSIDIPQPGGDMEALLRIRAREEGAGSATRFLAGLRKTSRGENFRPFINLANEQNVAGITVTTVGTGAFAADVMMPTGWKITTTTPGALLPISHVALSSVCSDQYRGTYRMFLRATQDSVPAGVVSFQVQQYIGVIPTGVLVWSSPVVTTSAIKLIEYLDMGTVNIPAVKSLRPFDMYWSILASGDGIEDGHAVDLGLLPVDEWAVDTYVPNLFPGQRGVAGVLGFYDDIDGITEPKNIPVAITAPWATGVQRSEPRLIGAYGGLIPNVTQRLHTLTMAGTPSTYFWAQLYEAESLEAWWVQRYSSMRGAR